MSNVEQQRKFLSKRKFFIEMKFFSSLIGDGTRPMRNEQSKRSKSSMFTVWIFSLMFPSSISFLCVFIQLITIDGRKIDQMRLRGVQTSCEQRFSIFKFEISFKLWSFSKFFRCTSRQNHLCVSMDRWRFHLNTSMMIIVIVEVKGRNFRMKNSNEIFSIFRRIGRTGNFSMSEWTFFLWK